MGSNIIFNMDLNAIIDAHETSGAGITISPIAFLTIHQGNVRVLQIEPYLSSVDRALEKVPDVVDKVTSLFQKEDRKEEPLPQVPAQPVEPVPQDV